MSSQIEHRLRLIQNISVPGVSYGNVALDYGDGIYGTRATDPADLQVYVAVPLTSGLSAPHAFRARVGDAFPNDNFAFRVVAFGGPFESGEGTVLDLSTVSAAELRLDRVSWGHPVAIGLRLTVDGTADTLTRTMTDGDLTDPGTYRMGIILTFLSERQLTIPAHDNRTLLVSDGGAIEVAPPPIIGPYDLWTGGTADTTGADLLTMGTAAATGSDTITLGDATT